MEIWFQNGDRFGVGEWDTEDEISFVWIEKNNKISRPARNRHDIKEQIKECGKSKN